MKGMIAMAAVASAGCATSGRPVEALLFLVLLLLAVGIRRIGKRLDDLKGSLLEL